MNKLWKVVALLGVVAVSVQCANAASRGQEALPEPVKDELANSRGVFVVPEDVNAQRKTPLEYWFVYQDGVVYVPSRTADSRVRTIQTGNLRATISVGTIDGPSFKASGSIVKDLKIQEAVFAGLQSKYPAQWAQFGNAFRAGFTNGTRVLIRYTPLDT